MNEVLLNGRFEGRPLYLVLDNRAREQLAEILDQDAGDVEAFCGRGVGAYLAKQGDPYSTTELELWRWTLGGRTGPPPFTALLFTLSHAAELMVSDGNFRASNYYERLTELTGVNHGRLSTYGKSTDAYWKAFSKWLADRDFQFGRPTARAINANKYVGVAMSQAIVREADRRRFHDMFEKYGFTGTDELTEAEVRQYVASWICTSKPTRQLKAAWAKTELQSRICEVVVAELEDWKEESGRGGKGAGDGVSRLSLVATFHHDVLSGGRRLSLLFGKEAALEPIELSREGAPGLELANWNLGGLATLEPRSAIETGPVLLRGLSLVAKDGQSFTWAGRPAIPLSRSEKGNYWSEVNRVSLGVEHVVLVRSDPKVRDSIERALGEVAAPGYTVATPDRLPGVPSGWLLYEGVKVLRGLDELKGFEAVLSPIATSVGLQFVGGVGLGRGIWHDWRPPTATLDGEETGVVLRAWDGASGEGPPACEVAGEGRAVSLDLGSCLPPSGNMFLEGTVAGHVTASASILFRSADRARPLDRQSRDVVSHVGVLATRLAGPFAEGVRGLIGRVRPVEVDVGIIEGFKNVGRVVDEVQPSERAIVKEVELPAKLDVSNMTGSQIASLPCSVLGVHQLKYAYVPPGYPRYAPVDVECKSCGIAFLHRREPTPRDKVWSGVLPGQNGRQAVPASPAGFRERDQPRLEMDLWLDAACFLGAGTVATFESIISSGNLDPWRTGSILRDLSWLGHLDVETSSLHRPKAWSISPPVASVIGDGEAVLSGFRCRALLQRVEEQAAAAGGSLCIEDLDQQPAVARIRGLDAPAISAAIADVLDVHGRQVETRENVAEELARFVISVSGVFDTFKPATLGWDADLQKFDVEQARWRNCEPSNAAGAYRHSNAGTGYIFRDTAGRGFSGPHELVKLAAARLEGVKLHAYLEDQQVFISRLGCEPPGLLGRALVACSGELPAVVGGATRFTRVSPAVAAAVLSMLYKGDLPS